MLPIPRTASAASAALLKISGLNLLLPQSEIRTLESAADIDTVAPPLHGIGWILYAQKHWPIYCLSAELEIMEVAPPERRACAMIAMGAGYIGIMCDDMIIQKSSEARHFELPLSMRLPNTPIQYLVEYKEDIACASSAMRLTSYIEQLVLNS